MSKIKLTGENSGYVEISAGQNAGNNTLQTPTSGTRLVAHEGSQDVTLNANLTVNGVLTYNDVTNIDSVGVVTARNGLHVTGGSVGIGLNNPDLKLHVNGTNALPSKTGSSPTGHLTLRAKAQSSTHGMFMGVSNAAPWSSWIQAQDKNNNAVNYPLLLNPNGGTIGIGTDNPSRGGIHIHKAATAEVHLTDDTTGSGSGDGLTIFSSVSSAGVWYRENSNLRFATNNTEKVRITSDGKVGIDSTTPHRQLVVGDGGDISCLGPNGGIYFGTSTGGFRNNGAIARAQQAGYHVSGSQVGDLVMAPEADKDLIISSGSTNTMYERLRVTTGGNIGINKSNPGDKLSISEGNLGIYNTGNNHGNVYFYKDGTAKGWLKYRGNDDKLVIGNVTDAINVKTSGNVGVGNADPTQAKFVAHTASGVSIAATKDNTGASISLGGITQPRILMEAGATASELKIYTAGGSSYGSASWAERLRVVSSGHIGVNNTNPQGIIDVTSNVTSHGLGVVLRKDFNGPVADTVSKLALTLWGQDHDDGISGSGTDQFGPMIGFGARNDDGAPNTGDIRAAISYSYNGDLVFHAKAGSPGVADGQFERLRIDGVNGSLIHKGNNSSTVDNTDGDGQASSGYPAGGATFNKNVSVNNNAGSFGQCMNMLSHTKSITLNGSTNHDMVTIWNREGCFIGHVYAGYSTSGDGAVAMYKFNTFYGANSIIAELGPSGRSSDSISVNITSSGDSHTFRVNGNGYSGDVTIGLVFLSAGVAGSAAHYGVRYY